MPASPIFTIDPAFAYPAGGRLRPSEACDAQDAWRHLTSAVARDPLDVESHARRVLLAIHSGQGPHVVTALLDLFLAVGDKARDLRSQLLQQAQGVLPPDEWQFFASHLDNGLAPQAGLPLGTLSVLDPGLMGLSDMVHQVRAQAREETLAERAAALIDQGDLDAARHLLEQGLLDRPDDAEAARELLAIYRHSRDASAETAMRERLVQRFGALPPAWA
jgi:tetratricopeptide (TPR) repeat protein